MKCACGFIAQHALQLISSACSLRKQASRKLLQNEQKFLFCTILKDFNVILTFCKLLKEELLKTSLKITSHRVPLKRIKSQLKEELAFTVGKNSVCACLRRLYHHMSRDCWPALNPHNQINLRPVTPLKHDLSFKAMQILGSLSY